MLTTHRGGKKSELYNGGLVLATINLAGGCIPSYGALCCVMVVNCWCRLQGPNQAGRVHSRPPSYDWEEMQSRPLPLTANAMSSPANTNMSYGPSPTMVLLRAHRVSEVTIGSSGLKISKIILGCAVYGSPDWYSWLQNEEESVKQIKAAYIPISLSP